MKNQKGFIIPLLIVIVALLAVGGGVYVYEAKKIEAPIPTIGTQTINQQTDTSSTDTSYIQSTTSQSVPNQPSSTTVKVDTKNNQSGALSTTLSSADITAITTAVQNFKQAFLNNDQQGVLKYSSATTQDTLKINQLNTSFKSMTIEKISSCDSSCRPWYYTNDNEVSVTLATISNGGISGTMRWGFVKENGSWKFDLGLTQKLAQSTR